MSATEFDYKEFEASTLAALQRGNKEILGEKGLFTPLLKHFLEKSLDAEISGHLSQEQGNKRNGKSRKTVKSTSGSFELETPRDRKGTFEPQIVQKRQIFLGENLESKILCLYAKGNSYEKIKSFMLDIYGLSISTAQISEITDKIIPEIETWQNRPLEEMYPFVWMDAVHFKVRDQGAVTDRAIYNVLALNKNGGKEILGFYVSQSETAKFWLQVLEDLQHRGVKDMLIVSIDNLSGFSDAIASIFPKTIVQSCIVHQIRNSLKYVVYKDYKEFTTSLKEIYKATNIAQAEIALNEAEKKWGEKYAPAFKSWRNNWYKLSSFFDFSVDIRRIMYTTNIIEGFHRQVRNITKSKGAFSSEMALKKLVYLCIKEVSKKWTGSQNNWGLVKAQLEIKFGDRASRWD